MSAGATLREPRDPTDSIPVRVTVAVAAILAVALVALSYLTLQIFVQQITPELERKGEIVAEAINGPIQRGLDGGIPLNEMRGMAPFVAEIVADHEEIGLVRLVDAQSDVVYEGRFGRVDAGEVDIGNLALSRYSVGPDEQPVATLTLGIDPGDVAARLFDIGYDVVITLLVALILTFEVLVLVIGLRIMTPIRALRQVLARSDGSGRTGAGGFGFVLPRAGRDEVGAFVQRVNAIIVGKGAGPGVSDGARSSLPRLRVRLPSDVRMPLFLFFFATELSRPFLPLYAEALYQPIPFISPELAITLPIVLYLGLVAALSPFSGVWVARLGARRTFLFGLVPTLIGLVMTGVAGTLYELILWRAVSALGFALTTIAALTYIAQTSTPETRARSMVTYTVAFVTAGICGTAIGGILADRIGYGPTFIVGGIIAGLAAVLVTATMPAADSDNAADAAARRDRLTFSGFLNVLTNQRFLILIGLASIPTQAISTGFLFFALPMLLDQLGYAASVIGRVMMIYFIVMALASRPLAQWADSLGRHGLFVAVGLILAGVAGIAVLGVDAGIVGGHEAWLLALTTLMIGFAHALCIPAQGALLFAVAEEHNDSSSTAIGVYRLLERIGSVAGPLIVAALAIQFTYAQSIAMLGTGLLISGLAFAALFGRAGQPPRTAEPMSNPSPAGAILPAQHKAENP